MDASSFLTSLRIAPYAEARSQSRAHVKRHALVAPIRNEHLPVNAIAWTFIQSIRHHANDLGIELRRHYRLAPNAVRPRSYPQRNAARNAR